MKNIFLDFGTHKGEGLLEFFQKGTIDNSFEVHTFEPTPGLGTEYDIEGLKKIEGFPQDIHFYNKAIWIKDGMIAFNNRMDQASHIEGIDFSYFQESDDFNSIMVECIDISKFIESLPDSNIICKMDIEGSEFRILRYLIYTGVIKRINKLFVEFHPKFVSSESDFTLNFLINSIKKLGIELVLWH